MGACEACLGHDCDVLGSVEARTLLIGGSDDLLFPEGVLEETARRIPGGELCILDDTGHGAPDKRKDEFDGEVLRFLSE